MAKSKTRSKKPSKAPRRPVAVKAARKPAPKPIRKVVSKTKAAMSKPSKQTTKSKIIEKPVQQAQPVIPANGKRAKNQAGLSTKEVESFRDLLLAKRRELLGDVSSMENEALQNGGGVGNLSNLPDHMADQGTDNYEQEFTLGLMEKDRKLLREIDLALQKIQNGTYGICEGTGKPISKARLEAQPWARYSIEYARKMENGGVR